MTAFWILAPVIVLAAFGVLFSRKTVHSALSLAAVMLSLAVLYLVQDAPFLFAVQIIVYTGAILMLFVFVLMLIGVESTDSLVETIKGQRLWAIVLGLLFAALLVLGVAQVSVGTVTGLDAANAGGNIEGLADVLFSRYVVAFEATAALLITAAIGTMVLAHSERLSPKLTQAETVAERMREYAETGKHPGSLPGPGTFARHNAVDTPALLPDGSVSEASVSRTLAARGTVQSAPELAEDMVRLSRRMRDDGSSNVPGRPDATPKGPLEGDPGDPGPTGAAPDDTGGPTTGGTTGQTPREEQ